MIPRITLLHGWGYDGSLWREVLPLLCDLDVEVADLGYFGHPRLPAACAAPRIAVGHSLGALWWLAQADPTWTRLVAINGFPRFTAAADFPQGVPARVLERMQKRFKTAPGPVLADFHAACGGPGPALPADTTQLKDGLALLGELDARAALARRAGNVWLLAARDDAIVPASLSAAAFADLPAGHMSWLEQGGHLLPLTQPQACAAMIVAAISA